MSTSMLSPLTNPLDNEQLQRLQSALDGLSPVQVAWVSGYLAGMAYGEASPAVAATPSIPRPDTKPQLTILYGSQTGNAETIAKSLGERAATQGLEAQVVSMGEYKPRSLTDEKLVLFVVSTHGEGEPTESAYALHAFLNGKRAPRLDQLRYAVLGLGDSSYKHFCQAAKDFDARLTELGAQRLFERVDCDVDYQSTANAWTGKVLNEFKELVPERSAKILALPDAVRLGTAKPRHGKNKPYAATLIVNQRIAARDAVSDVRHLALSVEPKAVSYAPGDALGVWFRNDPALADAVLAATGLDGEAAVRIGGSELGLRQALIERFELTRLHSGLVQAWAALAEGAALRPVADDAARLHDYVQTHQVIDLIGDHPARPNPAAFTGLLRPLQPRLYSIASSPAEYDDEIHLTVAVVRYRAFGRDHLGGASGFLAERLDEDAPVDVYVVENPTFRLPADGDTPIVMIGAGTGIAPYRAFMQQRAVNGDRGRNWLIFGNRRFHADFLYQLEWLRYRKDGLLTRVNLAFSRDQADKIYVQHRVREHAAELYRWLQDGAHLYVCGATQMGKDVRQALVNVAAEQAGLSPEDSREYVENLRRAGRYHQDVY